ncbi:hypothetical protein ACK2IE_02730 [Clostridioides difficile]|nr:hypothetical protein [Clostridioides difficile]MBT1525717.1 hypothetical protein [Clostridioides difficile]WKK91449.1 hypothetical protein Q0Y04_13940 [Clostridioides difficile]
MGDGICGKVKHYCYKKEKIEDIGMKLEHLLSEDITFYELLLEILYKEKEEN